MEVFRVIKSGSERVLAAGELCGELSHLYVLRLSPKLSIAAKRDGLLYAYRLLSTEEARAVAGILERLSAPSESDVRCLVGSLLAKGAEWGRRDMPVYRFGSTVVEVSPPRRLRRLLIKTDNPAVAEALKREFNARLLPRLKAWLVEAHDWRSVVERVRELAERAGGEKAEIVSG